MILSILIPVYNGLMFTKSCLNNIYKEIDRISKDSFNVHLILIDDGSTDGTSTWVKENYPQIHLLFGDGNLWWSGGINKGIEFALEQIKTDYVLWWNNDIVAGSAYFSNLYVILKENNDHHLVGSKILKLNEGLIWGMGGRFDPILGIRFMIGQNSSPDEEKYQKPFNVDWFPGMGTVIHKSVFRKIGLVDNFNFPQYHGDSDFTYKAKLNGFRLVAYPNLIILNDVSNTGLNHNDSFSTLYKSLTSIKSNYNFKKDFFFIRRYAKSYRVYHILLKKYLLYIGGFFKWKILLIFGKKRKSKYQD